MRLPLLLLAGLLVAAPALAQSTSDMARELNRLRDDVNALQRQVYRGGPPATAPGSAAPAAAMGGDVANRLSSRMDTIDEQMRGLTGRAEEQDYRLVQMQRRLDKLAEDIEFRLTELEKGRAGGAPVATAAPPAGGPPAQPQANTPAGQANAAAPASRTSDPNTPARPEGNLGTMTTRPDGTVTGGSLSATASQGSGPPPAPGLGTTQPSGRGRLQGGNPQERYNYAFGLLRQGDYADAEQAFGEFIRSHGDDPLAGNAQYWLGETYYVRREYEKAASAFLVGYQKYQKGNKAPDSLVKLGMSLNNMNQKQESCAVYGQFAKEFPQAPVALKQLANTERTRAGCK